MKTYTAKDEEGNIIYEKQPEGNLFGNLPLGTIPDYDNVGTLNRKDNGDAWEDAHFITSSGRKIIVKLDK